MAAREDQAQPIVGDVPVVVAGCRRSDDTRRDLRGGDDFLELPAEARLAAKPVDRAVTRGLKNPGTRERRDAGRRPLVECRDECVLRDLFGQVEVAELADQGRDDATPFGPVDTVYHFGGVRQHHSMVNMAAELADSRRQNILVPCCRSTGRPFVSMARRQT